MKQTNIDYEAEYYKIKKNNRCLAKALAEQQQLTKRFQDENSLLQKKLYNSSTLNMQYDKTINELLKYAKKNLDKCVDLANNFSDTLLLCHEGANLKKTLDGDNDVNDLYKVNLRSNSPGSHKTQAVKPMVSGHVIHHPTINLSRLSEPRVAVAHTTDNLVQNHNSSSSPILNNHGPMLHTNSHSRLPIQGYLGESDISDESDDSFDDDLTNAGTNLTPPRSARSLGPLMELSDEDSRSPNSSITKEVRIMLEPLHLENVTRRSKTVKFHKDLPEKPPSRKRPLDDPLEGTSTMLDNSGNMADDNNYVSKPRQASKRMCVGCDSDSDESTHHCDRNTKSKFVTKRRSLTKKKDITGQKYKVKRSITYDDKENNSTNDSLDGSNVSENFNISIEDGDNPFERRSRRLTPKCMAEPSLKMKMRR